MPADLDSLRVILILPALQKSLNCPRTVSTTDSTALLLIWLYCSRNEAGRPPSM